MSELVKQTYELIRLAQDLDDDEPAYLLAGAAAILAEHNNLPVQTVCDHLRDTYATSRSARAKVVVLDGRRKP
jgi:hypothetical protein